MNVDHSRCTAGILLGSDDSGLVETARACPICGVFGRDADAKAALLKLRANDTSDPQDSGRLLLPNDTYELLERYRAEMGEGRTLEQVASLLLERAVKDWCAQKAGS